MTAPSAGPDLPAPPTPEVPTDPPSRLTRTELVYGIVVAAELVTVAVMNLVVKGGKGAPAHPETSLALVAIVVSALVLPLLVAFRNRTVAGFATIIASLFVSLPKVPDRLSLTHAFALIFPIAYALIVTQRQRKALKVQLKAAGAPTRPSRPARRGRGSDRQPAHPPVTAAARATGRYTPPKTKRARR